MAFPGTYNISYYKGDTFEFLLNPKDTSGNPFNLTGYGTPRFTISNYAGPEQTPGTPSKVSIEGFAVVKDNTYIQCAITPTNATEMTAGQTYVYDVEISKTGSDYDYIYTLLTGKISVAEQVSLPVPKAVSSASFTVTAHTNTSITVTWEAPVGGPTITGYALFILPNFGPGSNIADATVVGNVDANTLTYTYTGLTLGTSYGLGVAAYNTAGYGTPGTTAYILGA